MASIITTVTGQDVLNNIGSQLSYVGRFSASDIDTNVIENTPLSEPEISVDWMLNLFIEAGLDGTNTTTEKAAYGTRAILWRVWCYYFSLSRQGEDCPPECKDPERFWELYNRGKGQVCHNLKLLGFSDPSGQWCRAENKGNQNYGLDIMGAKALSHNQN
jgi:hypothetical protein